MPDRRHPRLPFAAALLAVSSPALATGGFECRPVGGDGPVLTMGFGHGIAAGGMAVLLTEGQRRLSTCADKQRCWFAAGELHGPPLVVGQSWMDDKYLWLDLVDANATRFEAKLRASFRPELKGRPAIGTLERNSRTWQVRCIEA